MPKPAGSIDGLLGQALDIFRIRQYFDAISVAREMLSDDAELADSLRRGLLPMPWDAQAAPPAQIFPKPSPAIKALPWKKLAIVATGGSGAMSALVGVARACEEARATVTCLSFASGAALFGFPFAAGKSAEEIARFSLSVQPKDYIDPDWAGLAGLVPKLGRGFAGVLSGRRIEDSYREFLGDIRLGDLQIPAYAPGWDIERNRVEYFGPRTHPHLPVARAIRMAISIPLLIDPPIVDGHSFGDGGIVDILPVHPVLDIEPPPDAALVLNCFYPPGFKGEDVGGWRERTFSIVRAASQVRTAQQAQLARENLGRLRREIETVMLLEPVPYEKVRSGRFYVQFINRSSWVDFMRAGRTGALVAMRRHARARSAP